MRKFCKGLVVFAHTKISSFTLGGLMMIWSFLALWDENSLFARSLHENDVAAEFGVMMFLNGALLVAGSMFPWRAGRHIGLALCCFQFFALGGYFFRMGLYTPVSLAMPYLGLMSLITLMAEVKGKPRHGCS